MGFKSVFKGLMTGKILQLYTSESNGIFSMDLSVKRNGCGAVVLQYGSESEEKQMWYSGASVWI
jgi:hypothetical protein